MKRKIILTNSGLQIDIGLQSKTAQFLTAARRVLTVCALDCHNSTMKSLGPLSSLLPLSLLFISALPSLAVPSYSDAQAVFSQKPLSGVSKGAANGSEKNIERWNHEGKEYIKQDDLLCENPLFSKPSCCWHAVNIVDRWICRPPGFQAVQSESNRTQAMWPFSKTTFRIPWRSWR